MSNSHSHGKGLQMASGRVQEFLFLRIGLSHLMVSCFVLCCLGSACRSEVLGEGQGGGSMSAFLLGRRLPILKS